MNIELLKDAVALIDGIPEGAINLEKVVHKIGKTLDCDTIACAAGWLSLHPTFAAKINPRHTIFPKGLHVMTTWRIDNGIPIYDYALAMAELFNTGEETARQLFSARGDSRYDKAIKGLTDKQVWLRRARLLLQKQGKGEAHV